MGDSRDVAATGIDRLIERFDRLEARLTAHDRRFDRLALASKPSRVQFAADDMAYVEEEHAYERRRFRSTRADFPSMLNRGRAGEERWHRGVFYSPPYRTTGHGFSPQVCNNAGGEEDRWRRDVFHGMPHRSSNRELPHQQQTIGTWVPQARPRQPSSWDRPAARSSTVVEQDYRGLRQQTCWETPLRQNRALHLWQESPKEIKLSAPRFEGSSAADGTPERVSIAEEGAVEEVDEEKDDAQPAPRKDMEVEVKSRMPEGVQQTAALGVSNEEGCGPCLGKRDRSAFDTSVSAVVLDVIHSQEFLMLSASASESDSLETTRAEFPSSQSSDGTCDIGVEDNGQHHSPRHIGVFFLSELKETPEVYFGKTGTKDVITIQNYFNDVQLQATANGGNYDLVGPMESIWRVVNSIWFPMSINVFDPGGDISPLFSFCFTSSRCVLFVATWYPP